jgi:hypothetical protein
MQVAYEQLFGYKTNRNGGLIWINKPIKLEYKVCEIKKIIGQ